MNLLRNKFVVIALAVVALLMLLNSFRPMWQRGRSYVSTPSTPAPKAVPSPAPTQVATNAPVSSTSPQAEAAEPGSGIELARVGWGFDGAPRRDPFQVIGPGPTNLARLYPSAAELLTLNAVWWQSGNILAEVNNRIVQVGNTIKASKGDMTAEFKVLNIGLERLWVHGPNGEEHVIFDPTLSLRGIAVKAPEGTNDNFAVAKTRLNWPYRVVNGVTNDVDHDAGWATFSGKVVEKLDEGKYLVDSGEGQFFILKGVPLDKIHNESLPPVRCKYVGTDSYDAVRTVRVSGSTTESFNANERPKARAFDFGVPCSPPKEVIDSLKLQKEFLLQQYSQANERRFRIEMQEAEKGTATAQYMLGRRYLYGDGVAEDEEQARRWLEKAAVQGELDAQATLLILGFQK